MTLCGSAQGPVHPPGSRPKAITPGASYTGSSSMGNVEVVVCSVIDPCLSVDVGLIAARSWSHAALRIDTLDVRHSRKRASSFVRFRFKQQPGNRAAPRCRCLGFLFPDDFAAVIRFPSGSGIMLRNFVSMFVCQIRFRGFEAPFELAWVIGSCFAVIDLHPLAESLQQDRLSSWYS